MGILSIDVKRALKQTMNAGMVFTDLHKTSCVHGVCARTKYSRLECFKRFGITTAISRSTIVLLK